MHDATSILDGKPAERSAPCNLCGRTATSLLASRSRSGKPLRTVICANCGLVWSDPLPHDPRSFYAEAYRIHYKNAYSPKPKHILRAGNVALSRLGKIEGFLSAPLSILDVGSGGGEFSYLLKTLGHDVKGIEPNEGYAGYSVREYGLDVQVRFVQDAVFREESLDMITMWHVLEHTENPSEVLAKLRTFLKGNGVLVLEVPNIEATCQSPGSTFHEAHLFNFNLATLKAMAEKTGFSVTTHSISPDGGNITLMARKASWRRTENIEVSIDGNAEKIAGIIRNHTNLRHFATARPYLRLLGKIRQSILEKRGTADFSGGKQMLDRLFSPKHNPA